MWAHDLSEVKQKPAEKLKLASNSYSANNCVWIFHGPLMVIEKSSPPLLSTEQFDADGKFTFFKQHLDLKQHGHNSILTNGDGRQRMFSLMSDWLLTDVWHWAGSVPNQAVKIGIQLGQSILFQSWLKDLQSWRGLLLCETGKGIRVSDSEHKQGNYF